MSHFDILYYDGKSSLSHYAVLILMSDHWLINYTDQNQLPQSVRWEINKIERDPGFNSLFIFRYGDFPKQTFECRDENLLLTLKALYPEKAFFEKKVNALFRQNTFLIAGLALLLIGIISIAYLYLLPWFAGVIAEKIPRSLEEDLGNKLFENTISQYTKDDSLTKKVNAFVKQIDFKTDYPIKVTVVKQDEVNAFALPGGNIVVFDKILREIKTKEELAALLAHEVAHIHYRHSLKGIFRSLSGYLLISLIFNDVSGISAIIADNSNMLLNLSYSRSLEAEADEKAAEILIANGLDMKGFTDLFALLKIHAKDSATFKLLSTHPLTDERILFAKKAALSHKGIKNNTKLDSLWRSIAY